MKTSHTASSVSNYPGPAWNSQPWPGRAPPSVLARLGRLIARRRRLVAALLLCAAAAVTVQQLIPASAPTVAVFVAARDLPAGHILAESDVSSVTVSPSMVPVGAFTPASTDAISADIDGGQLSGPLRRGEVLTDASLLGSGLLTGTAPGSQAVPLRLSDSSTLSLLRQGQLVTVILSSSIGLDGPTTNEVLAEGIPVLWTPSLAPSSGGLLPSSQDTEAIVVVAASPEEAVTLAGAINRGKVFLILLN